MDTYETKKNGEVIGIGIEVPLSEIIKALQARLSYHHHNPLSDLDDDWEIINLHLETQEGRGKTRRDGIIVFEARPPQKVEEEPEPTDSEPEDA